MNKASKHEHVCKELLSLYIEKNKAYGDSFSLQVEEFGLISAVIRMSDKLYRIKNLVKNPSIGGGESLRDNLIDLANYAVLSIIELDKTAEQEIDGGGC